MRPLLSLLALCYLLPTPGAGAAPHGTAAPARATLMLSGGISGVFDTEKNPAVHAELRFARNWRGVHPWVSAGWATDGAVFLGGGVLYGVATEDGVWAATAGFGPGYYERHEGADLGSHTEFCSFAEVSRGVGGGRRVAVRLLHVSNGGLKEKNPGAELLMIGYSIPLP